MSDDFYPQRGPGEIQRYLQDMRAELVTIDVQLQQAHDLVQTAEEAWIEHYDLAMAKLEARHDRLPGEEVRLSFARRMDDGRDRWNLYRRAKKAVEKLERRHKVIADGIGAAQSEAKL